MVNMEAREDLKTVAHEVFRIIDDCVKFDACIEEVIPKGQGPELLSHYRIYGTMVNEVDAPSGCLKLPTKLTKVDPMSRLLYNRKPVAFVFEVAHEEIRFHDGLRTSGCAGEFIIFHYSDPKLFEKVKAKVEEYT